MTTTLSENDLRWDVVLLEDDPTRRIVNNYYRGLVTLEEYAQDILTNLERDVGYTAALLDEHCPGWASKITKPLRMQSVTGCVLGQVFAKPTRRLFRSRDHFDSGFERGLTFLLERGYIDKPYVFTSHYAVPFWEAEIAKRG